MVDVNKIIEGAIQDLMDDSSLSRVLLKAQAVASLLDSKELKEWVKQEEYGWEYDKVPFYRQLPCVIKVSVIKGCQWINDFTLPDAILPESIWHLYQVKFNNSIFEAEALASGSGALKTSIPAHFIQDINTRVNGQIQGAWQEVHHSAVNAIVSKVKASLLEYFLELNKTMVLGVNLQNALTKERIARIAIDTLNIGIVNSGNIDSVNSVVGDNNHVSLSETNKELLTKLMERLQQLENEVDEDRESIAELIVSIRQELDDEKCDVNIIQNILSKIKAVPSVITDAAISSIVENIISSICK